jgi:CBS domain-containing protein
LVEADLPRIAPDASLQELARDGILRQSRRAFLVTSATGDIEGLVTLTDLRRTPESEWGGTPVRQVMTPLHRLITVTPQTEMLAAIQLMVEHDINQVPVVSGGTVIGWLTRALLLQAIEQRLAIGAMHGTRA